jgi:hypothetical protein
VAEILAISTESWVAAFSVRVAMVLALHACYDIAGNLFRSVTEAKYVANDIAELAVVVLGTIEGTVDGNTVASLVAVTVLLLLAVILLVLLLLLILVLVLILVVVTVLGLLVVIAVTVGNMFG